MRVLQSNQRQLLESLTESRMMVLPANASKGLHESDRDAFAPVDGRGDDFLSDVGSEEYDVVDNGELAVPSD